MEILTPEQQQELTARGACPYWMRVNPTGWCVDKWWAGGPTARIIDGVTILFGMAIVGVAIAKASKIKLLAPTIEGIKQARAEAKLLENSSRWRALRRRQRRR